MKYLNIVPKTAGEQLFQFILSSINPYESYQEIPLLKLLAIGSRTEVMSEYFYGAYSFNLMARCIKKAKGISRTVEDSSKHQPLLIQYFQSTLGILDDGSTRLNKLAILTFKAVQSSGRKINNTTRTAVVDGYPSCSCYICGNMTTINSDDPYTKTQFEHIWPSSYGGDSIPENLLPSCGHCNKEKSDMLLWQDSDIHSFVLMPNAEDEELKNISRRQKIAKQRFYIFDTASAKNISLKEAAYEIGPMNLNSLSSYDEDDSIDFFNLQLGVN